MPAIMEAIPQSTSATAARRASGRFIVAAAVVTAVYFAIALYRIADVPLLDPDEPRYASAGRSMSRGESLLVPVFNGQPRINKPPLFYWLVALSDKLSGNATEITSRAPSILMGLAMLWGTMLLGRIVFDEATGALGGLILSTIPLFAALSRCCITDMTLSAFMAGALGWLMLGMLGLAPPRRSLWIAAILLGLAVLTKATAALAVVLVIIIARAMQLPATGSIKSGGWIPWLLAAALVFSAVALHCDNEARKKMIESHKRAVAAAVADSDSQDAPESDGISRWRKLDAGFKYASLGLSLIAVAILCLMAKRAEALQPNLPRGWKAALILAVLMGLWWYAALILRFGWNEFQKLVNYEVGQRLAGNVHREPMHYYLLVLAVVTFPWSIGLGGAVATMIGARKESDTPSKAESFLLAWLLGILFFFSIPGAKLATYVLPAMPAAALLTVRFMFRLSGKGQPLSRRAVKITQGIAIALAVLLLIAPFLVPLLPKDFPEYLQAAPAPLWCLTTGAAIVFPGAWLLASAGFRRTAPLVLTCGALTVVFAGLPPALPKLHSNKDLCIAVRPTIADCERIAAIGLAVQSLSYYLDHQVEDIRWQPPDTAVKYKLASDELKKAASTAIFMERRYYQRMFGGDLKQSSAEQVRRSLPENMQFVYADKSVVVIRN